MTPKAKERAPRRLTPDERRRQIVDAARPLFAARPVSELSTADVAEAAGVARSLVHHYFDGISGVFLAVAAEGAASLADRRTVTAPVPLDERLAHNIPAGLDVVEENRETWLAVVGHERSSGDAQIDALIAAAHEYNIDQTIRVHSDLLRDTPAVRSAVSALLMMSLQATRRWINGQLTREQIEAFLITTWREALLKSIPALEEASAGRSAA